MLSKIMEEIDGLAKDHSNKLIEFAEQFKAKMVAKREAQQERQQFRKYLRISEAVK